MQTILSQTIQLLSPNPDILESPRQTQVPNHSIQDIAQISRLCIHTRTGQNIRNDGVGDEELPDEILAFIVGILGCIVFAHCREEDAACFTVTDAERAELYMLG